MKHMMSYSKHKQGAFHHSCWGAEIIVASAADREEDELGMSLSSVRGILSVYSDLATFWLVDRGSDRPEGFKPAYYVMNATIPKNIPNGVRSHFLVI